MPDVNTVFTRLMLKAVHADVRKAFPEIRDLTQAAGVTKTMRGQWCVQITVPGSGDWFWHGRAHNAAEARSKAWRSYLDKHAPQEDAA